MSPRQTHVDTISSKRQVENSLGRQTVTMADERKFQMREGVIVKRERTDCDAHAHILRWLKQVEYSLSVSKRSQIPRAVLRSQDDRISNTVSK